jgi:hypothetical protein
MSAAHALLSASSSHRWLACPPSALRCANTPDKGSEYARQGTAAHALCQFKVERALGRNARDPTEDLDYFDEEMDECSDQYCSYVMEQVSEAEKHCADPAVFVEQRLDFSRWVPEGFGTGDCVIVADDILQIIDYKHGLGIVVNAEMNPQMMCYALGALEMFDGIYDINTVRMTIFQPRRDNISTFEISKTELLKWADEVLAPTAKLAYKGEGEYRAGDHCQFCAVKAACRTRAEYNLELAKYDFQMPPDLSDDEIDKVLIKADELVSWVNDIKEYALRKALSGTVYPDFKVVEGRSITKYTDEDAAAEAVSKLGLEPYEKKLLGITAMRSLLGKKRFEEVLGGLTYKPPGKPALVPRSDKRPEMNTAKTDFENV